MMGRIFKTPPASAAPGIIASGVFLVVVSLLGLILGLMLIESLSRDFEASIEVSRSAITSVGDTLDLVDDVATEASTSIGAAARSAGSASAAARGAVGGLSDVAGFLDGTLPEDIEAIQSALPGAISAADAADTTLKALSLLGVDYSPEEPLGDSLRRIRAALVPLPDEIRVQGGSLRSLVPLSNALADDIDGLALSLEELRDGLSNVDGLTDSYARTADLAATAIGRTDVSLDRTVLLLRLFLILLAVGGAVVGITLISIDRTLGQSLVEPASTRERAPV